MIRSRRRSISRAMGVRESRAAESRSRRRATRPRRAEGRRPPATSQSFTRRRCTPPVSACGSRSAIQSSRWRGPSSSASPRGSARERSPSRWRRWESAVAAARDSLAPMFSDQASSSSRTGTASSAAAVGVGARMSET